MHTYIRCFLTRLGRLLLLPRLYTLLLGTDVKSSRLRYLLLPRLYTLLLRKVNEWSIPRFIAGKSALYFRLNHTRGLFRTHLKIYMATSTVLFLAHTRGLLRGSG